MSFCVHTGGRSVVLNRARDYWPPFAMQSRVCLRLTAANDSEDPYTGHCGLSRRAIVHQDVGLHNILLGAPDAPDGHMGVLVDHDIGPSLLRDPGDAYVDFRTVRTSFTSWEFGSSSHGRVLVRTSPFRCWRAPDTERPRRLAVSVCCTTTWMIWNLSTGELNQKESLKPRSKVS